MDSCNEVEYKLRDLPTRSVSLFPTRAQIFREIKDVPLKPGDNKITIIGLSPTVDKDSVKVEGSGLAVITNSSVTKEDNPEIFEEIYPEHDTSVHDHDDRPESNEDLYEKDLKNLEETPELKEARAHLVQLQEESRAADEAVRSAMEQLQVLDNFSKNLGKGETSVDISQFISTYRTEREKMFKDQQDGERKQRELSTSIQEASMKVSLCEVRQQHERDVKEWEKRQQEKEKRKDEEREARRRKKEEQKKIKTKLDLLEFWPKFVYSVCITLDVNAYTPSSSRRSSITSEIELAKASPAPASQGEGSQIRCDLVLSYVTTSAFWAPSYDMQLNTISATGTLLFDAQLHNSTSETWTNCQVTLSTSQATAANLDEPIPTLVPWHIRLMTKSAFSPSDDISLSKEEQKRKAELLEKNSPITSTQARSDMFQGDQANNRNLQDYQMQLMLLEQQNKGRLKMARQEPKDQRNLAAQPAQMVQQNMFQEQSLALSGERSRSARTVNSMVPPPAPPTAAVAPSARASSLFRRSGGGGLFGSAAPQSAEPTAPALAAIPPPPASGAGDVLNDVSFDSFLHGGQDPNGDSFSFANTASEPLPALDFKDSLVEETGLTTAYDLPGTKTLAPGMTSSKHRVARLSLSSIAFSYTVVPKYKAAAYLKAKIRNGSKITLLRGTLGLTVDGSFMGRTMLPRCSAGETMTLGLGVDPAIKVQYPGPDVRRATTGLFNKEDCSVYARSVTLESTRSSTTSKPFQIFVHDQVPVSEDERLKVVTQVPHGLAVNAGSVKAGREGSSGEQGKGWGSADAIMKETGTVTWNVKLNPGKSVKLELEYLVAMPSGGGHSAVSLG